MRKTALITGASGGIGLELARCFARGGFDLVLTARDEIRLHQAADELSARFKINARIIAKDLSQPQAPHEIWKQLQEDHVHVDVLVNNAGFSTYGPFRETDLEIELQMMQVNIVALTHLSKLFLPAMIERKSGRILNVASTAAFAPGPLMAVYYASKAFVLSFSRALSNEVEGSGVRVCCLCPGMTTSGFQERAGMRDSLMMEAEMMDAATVARLGYRGLMRGQSVIIPGRRNRGFALLTRLLPAAKLAQIIRRAQEKRSEN